MKRLLTARIMPPPFFRWTYAWRASIGRTGPLAALSSITQFAVCLGVVSAILLSTGRPASAQIRVGVGKRIITPQPLLPVSGGMGPTQAAHTQQGELTARALVISSADTQVAIVSLDLLGFPGVLGDRVRAQVKGIPADHILIGATHTHSAPDCYAFPDGQGGHTGDLDYINRVCQLTAEAINEAVNHPQDVELKVASGVAHGKIAYNYYAPDLYDPRVNVLQFVRADGSAVATLVNYAIHPEVIGAEQGVVSPDLIGPLCETIEHKTGGFAIFMNSAQGGMITADNRDLTKVRDPQRAYWDDIQTWDECVRIGQTLAAEALRVVEPAARQHAPKLACISRQVKFPVESAALWAVVSASPLQYPHNDDHSVNTRLNVIQLGSARLATVPGEALPNIGFYLKRKLHGENNFLLGLTNDAFGYILTRVDFASFPRYEYVSRVSLGEETGEILIRNLLEMDAELR